MKNTHKHLASIVKGSYAMMHLKKGWCDHIGNTKTAFFWALLFNIVAVPLSVYVLPQANTPEAALTTVDQLLLKGVMIPLVALVVLVLAAAHRRHHKFALIYAGITYVGFVIALVLWGVEAVMNLYHHSLYAQDAPMLAHGLLVGAVLWTVVVIAFVFKTALEIRAAMSLLMASVLLFVLIAGQLLLQMTLFESIPQ